MHINSIQQDFIKIYVFKFNNKSIILVNKIEDHEEFHCQFFPLLQLLSCSDEDSCCFCVCFADVFYLLPFMHVFINIRVGVLFNSTVLFDQFILKKIEDLIVPNFNMLTIFFLFIYSLNFYLLSFLPFLFFRTNFNMLLYFTFCFFFLLTLLSSLLSKYNSHQIK